MNKITETCNAVAVCNALKRWEKSWRLGLIGKCRLSITKSNIPLITTWELLGWYFAGHCWTRSSFGLINKALCLLLWKAGRKEINSHQIFFFFLQGIPHSPPAPLQRILFCKSLKMACILSPCVFAGCTRWSKFCIPLGFLSPFQSNTMSQLGSSFPASPPECIRTCNSPLNWWWGPSWSA